MNDDLIKFKALYIETAKEQIQAINSGLSLLKNSYDLAIIEKIFVAAHSLKGQSLMMGFAKVGELSHTIEKIFRGLKEGSINQDMLNTDLVSSAVQKIDQWLLEHPELDSEPELSDEINKLGEALN